MIAHQDIIEASRVISRLLTERGLSLGVAESFTGGLISSSITKIEGASQFFLEGIICYSQESKMTRLGVKKSTLDEFGAVSCACLKEMLLGLLRGGVDVAIATSGNAGPTAGNGSVGVCFVGVAACGQMWIQKTFTRGERAAVIDSGALRAIISAIELVSSAQNS